MRQLAQALDGLSVALYIFAIVLMFWDGRNAKTNRINVKLSSWAWGCVLLAVGLSRV